MCLIILNALIKLNKKDELLNKDILKQKGYWGEISDEEY
jgi:hypothetical protein